MAQGEERRKPGEAEGPELDEELEEEPGLDVGCQMLGVGERRGDWMLERPASSIRKAGFIALIGRPNVGKSTLMNRLLGHRLSIVSEKPQTTRNRILGIKTLPSAQLLFLDTPGIHRAQALFNREMVKVAMKALEEADLVLWIVEAPAPLTEDDQLILQALKKVKTPIILAINKIDLVKKAELLPMIERFAQLFPFKEIVPISATSGDNVDRLEALLVAYLPEGHPFYPPDQLTDRPERFIIGELIREKIFHLLYQEIPYAVAVTVEEVKERPDRPLIDVQATIHVEKDSQKGIVIGSQGRMLKKIGRLAREEIEALLGSQVFLNLWVKVRPNWRRDEEALRRFGYLQK